MPYRGLEAATNFPNWKNPVPETLLHSTGAYVMFDVKMRRLSSSMKVKISSISNLRRHHDHGMDGVSGWRVAKQRRRLVLEGDPDRARVGWPGSRSSCSGMVRPGS